MDLRQLETFVTVATLRSFRASAQRLHVTQPAVSARISALETELGSALFDRQGQRVRLTAKGVEMLGHAQEVLRVSNAMADAARGTGVSPQSVRIGALGSMVHSLIPALIERLRKEFPMLDVEITVDSSPRLRALLLEREIDLAMTMGPIDILGILNIPLSQCQAVWVASHCIDLPSGTVPLDRIARFPVMTYSKYSETYRAVMHALQARGLWPVRLGGSNSTEAILRIAESGFAIGVVVADSMRGPDGAPRPGGLAANPRLRVLKVDARLPRFEYTANYRSDSRGTAAEAVAALAQSVSRGDDEARRPARKARQPAL